MAIISVNETLKERTANRTATSKTYKRYYIVVSDNILDEASVVFDDTNIPNIGDKYWNDEDAILTSLDASIIEEDARLIWLVTAVYTWNENNVSVTESTQQTKPWENEPTISASFKNYVTIVENSYQLTGGEISDLRDMPGKTIQNSAYTQFDPPATKEISNLVLNVSFNMRYDDFDIQYLEKYKDTINKNKITIAGIKIKALRARITKISPVIKYYTNQNKKVEAYWNVTYDIEIADKDWNLMLLDYGFKDRDGKYYLDDIKNSDTMYKLDNSGNFLTNQLQDALPLTFEIYWRDDWSELDFPV